MSDDHEVDEQVLRDSDDALTEAIEEIEDQSLEHEAIVSARVKHCLAVLRLAGVPLDCQTGEALQRLGAAIQSVIHGGCDEP